MTRINVIPVEELSDQHLIAEYRELPRAIKIRCDIKNAPSNYILGKGHVKWGKKHSLFLIQRYEKLCIEMKYRGFNTSFDSSNLYKLLDKDTNNTYFVTKNDILINLERIKSRYNQKPQWYRWTKREKPKYLENNC